MVFIKKIYFYDYSKYFMISNEFGKIIVIIIQVFLLYSFIGKKNTRTLLLRKSRQFMNLCLKQSFILFFENYSF